MGKTKDKGGLLETMEENQNKVSDVKGIRLGALESQGTCVQQKRLLENGESPESNLFKQNNSQAGIYVHA